MGVYAGPDVSESGLVLALDVGNKKTFANSVINSTSWDLGSGSASGYGQNGSTVENERVTGTDPFGKSATVWETRPTGTTDADGGWNSDWYNIDNTKLYRFSVWVKRTSTSSGGTFYLGLYGNASGIRRTDNNTVEGNPYWDCRGTGGFIKDVWYLVVGHCYPYNTTYTGQHPESGIYTVAGGVTKVASINACNIGADVKWAGSDVTQTLHRCYHYYCGDSTTRLQLFDPRIDAIDGTEPSISALLSGFTANRLTDLVGTNNGTFKNAPTYSSANGGSVSFDGSNDYINCGSNSSLGLSALTLFAWVKASADVSNYRGIIMDEAPNGSSWNYRLYINQSSGVVVFDVNGGGYSGVSSTYAINNNQWYHICAVRTAPGGTQNLYINGILNNSGSDGTTISTLANVVWIGQSPYNNGAYPFNGNIAQVSIYNRALTASEVQQNFNANRSRFGI